VARGEEIDGEVEEPRFIEAPHIGENLQQVLEMAPIIETPDKNVQEILDRMLDGKCGTCGNDLEEHSMVCVTANGIAMVFCSGVCMTDMQVIGFLEELHDDIVDRIKFRSAAQEGEHD
jgi:hypothetical protein